MAEKTIEIFCAMGCMQHFDVTSEQIGMKWFFNGGCPYTELTVTCPKCGIIHPRMTPELQEFLKDRIEAHDYNNSGTVVANSPQALEHFGLI